MDRILCVSFRYWPLAKSYIGRELQRIENKKVKDCLLDLNLERNARLELVTFGLGSLILV